MLQAIDQGVIEGAMEAMDEGVIEGAMDGESNGLGGYLKERLMLQAGIIEGVISHRFRKATIEPCSSW